MGFRHFPVFAYFPWAIRGLSGEILLSPYRSFVHSSFSPLEIPQRVDRFERKTDSFTVSVRTLPKIQGVSLHLSRPPLSLSHTRCLHGLKTHIVPPPPTKRTLRHKPVAVIRTSRFISIKL